MSLDLGCALLAMQATLSLRGECILRYVRYHPPRPQMPTPPKMPRAARGPSNGRLVSSVRAERWDERGIDYLNPLRAFCLAARCGSITRAAAQLSATQPLVSAHVRALETALGAQLFDRRRRYITLTRAGEALHRLAEPLVTGVDRLHDTFLERRVGTSPGAVLAIGAGRDSAAHVLPSYLKQFQAQYPDARVQVRTGTGEQRLAWLRGYEMDLIIAAVDVLPPDIEFYPILNSEFVVITPENHPLAGQTTVSVKEITAYPFIAHAPEHYIEQTAEAYMRMHRVRLDVVVEVDSWVAISRYVAADVGIALVPDFCHCEGDRVRKISIKDPAPARQYGAIIRRDSLLCLAASRLLRIIAPDQPRSSDQP